MTGRLRNAGRIAALLVSTALCGALPNAAAAQSAGDPTDPQTWRTPEFMAQYGLDWIGADYAYARGLDGSGVTVGVIDTGIDMTHPEFAGRDFQGLGWDGVDWTTDLVDHGTTVAAILAANRDGKGMHGVAPRATVLEATFMDRNGDIDSAAVPGAVDWLVSKGAPFILFELGHTFQVTETTAEEYIYWEGATLESFRRATAAGTLLIVPTHNQGLDNPNPQAGLPYLFPELEENWLAVTGYDYPYGNKCGVAKNWCIAAPASSVYTASSGGGYLEFSGTSIAGPFVAGAAALVKQMFPYMTPNQVKQVLLGTALDVGDPGVDDVYGYGFLDVGSAIDGPGKFDWGDFHVVQPSGVSIWGNDISGAGGLIKSGGGALVLTGDSTYRGDTRIAGGVLAIDGSIASRTFVEEAAMLSGTGMIHADVDNRGVVYAGCGGCGGTLSIDGNYTAFSGSALWVDIGVPGGVNRLAVSGTATLAGMVDSQLVPGGYRGDISHTILTAGSIAGKFDGVFDPFAFLDLSLRYDPTAVRLDVVRNGTAFADLAPTANGAAAARAIENLGPGNAMFDAVIDVDAEQAGKAFSQLNGEIHASIGNVLIDNSGLIQDAMSSRLRSAAGNGAGAIALPVMAYGPGGPELAPANSDRFAVWTQALGAFGQTDSDGNAAGLDRSTGGVLFGGDAALGDSARLGIVGGYSRTTFDTQRPASDGSAKTIHLGVYAGAEWGALAFRSGAAYAWSDIETSRTIGIPGTLTAEYDAGTAQVFGEVGYRMETGQFRFEPFAGLAYVNLRTEGFSETGSFAALNGLASTNDATFTTLGLHAATDFAFGSVKATARGMLGWRHAFGDVTPAAALAFSGGSPFTVQGLPIARDALVFEAGLDAAISEAATVGLSYSGQLGGGAEDHTFGANLRVRF